KIQSITYLLTISLVCGSASTARSDNTAYFSAGVGSTNPGVYQITASTPGAKGSLLIPAGGSLSLTDPEGLAMIPNNGTKFSGATNYSLLVSSRGTNAIDAYDLDGNAEGIFVDQVADLGRMAYAQYFSRNDVFVVAGEQVTLYSVGGS